MTFIENYIRKKLGRADAPPEVNGNDLWADIESQLAPERESPQPATLIPRNAIFLVLFLLVGAGGAWLLSPTFSPETELAEAVPPPEITATVVPKPDTDRAVTTAPAATGAARVAGTETSGVAASSPNPPPAEKAVSTVIGTDDINDVFDKTTPEKSADQPRRPSLFTHPKTNPAKDNSGSGSSTVSPEETGPEKPFFAPAAAPPGAPPETATKPDPVPEPVNLNERTAQTEDGLAATGSADEPAKMDTGDDAEAEKPIFKSLLGARLSLGLHTGINLHTRRYAAGGEGPGAALNTAVSPATGTSFGLDLAYRITNRLSVSTGLEYHRTLNRFDHITTTDTLVAHPSEFNGGFVDAVATRRTTHNHRLHFLTVPLLVNHTWSFGDFDLGVGAGLGFNFRQSATGKTLDANNSVVAYDVASGDADVQDFFLSYRLRPVLAWQPRPGGKLRFEFTGNLSYQFYGVSPLSGVKQRGFLLGGTTGLRYDF